MDVTIQFWLLFALLNSLYFWPRYLLSKSTTSFFPIAVFFQESMQRRLNYVLIRMNYDVFRLSIDFLVLTVLFPLFLIGYVEPLSYTIVLFIYFGLSLTYQVYYTAFDKLYHVDPVLFNDWFMLKVAFRIFFHEYGWKNFFITIAALICSIGMFFLLHLLVTLGSEVTFGIWSYLAFGILLLAGVFSITQYRAIQFPQLVFQSQLGSFTRNIWASVKARQEVKLLTLDKMMEYNISDSIKLKKRPNLYFIVVESYGQIILEHPSFRDDYLQYLKELETKLKSRGWNSTSNLTISPVTGGGSWISYTSMLYGLNVKGQGLYLTMFKNKHIEKYDSLFNWLRRIGYSTYRLSSLGGYENMVIPYDQYSKLYGIDHWIKYADLNYKGPKYGFGPSPPDQYAIHFAEEKMNKDGSGPRAMFYITQNSHTPFESPNEVVDDWQDLIDEEYTAPPKSKIWSKPDFNLYGKAIEYQLRFLTNFIQKEGSDDDIFILVGDHQPASLSIPISTFETPIHIISKDAEFVDLFNEYAFVDGLNPDAAKEPIAQEAIHWALVRSLIKRYGEEDDPLPEYLPKGIQF